MHWKNIYRGLVMGIADLIPGVSGGTMAVILGIYQELIHSINGFFSKDWKKHLGFLVPLGIGIAGALVLFSSVIRFLLANYSQPTFFFFTGLVIGVIPVILVLADSKKSFNAVHFVLITVAAVAVALTAFVREDTGALITDLSMGTMVLLFFAGWMASMAMLLPGISGSLILLLFGVYATAIDALSITSPNFPVIFLVGSGVVLGFVISSKAIRYLFKHYPSYTYAVVVGLLIGSIFVVFPGFGQGSIVLSILSFLLGAGLAFGLGRK
ncbi:DUF368 domain-containing protein [Paenalkalicoccus suaedae]|uniref:DUF368 domain-containing protein n=1 Tax=Paenalkalicoccus suaedae TaxID=2592382 RepID=A0A859FEX5_9BACI|nr:DUF368 domain-containing protein [Paenalkalicoccus suaedae]QKS70775.1 DUF368 domain-containing protein [Paenalkalicoccus suaedae]